MDLLFATDALQRLCEDRATARRRLGSDCANKLMARLADLAAVEVLGELVAGRPHPLTGDRRGQFAVVLARGVRLVLEAADSPVPATPDGATDWRRVTKVRIVAIENYHD